MNFKFHCIFLILGLFAFTSFARADVNSAFILCKHDKMVRTLRMDNSSEVCKAIYTKQGIDQVIGSAQNKDSCHNFLTQVRKNLEEGSWNCRDIKESRVSNLEADEAQ